jgi:hypothetical protein
MSDLDLHEIQFEWPHAEPNSVVVTGTFDQWSSSQALTKTPAGFVGRAKVPWDRKFFYKFIVDGKWALKNDLPIEVELGTGFVNHVYISPPKPVEALPIGDPSAGADAGKREGTKGSLSPVPVDHKESAVSTTVPVNAPANETSPRFPSSAEHTVAVVPEVTPSTGKPAKEVQETTQVTKPAEEYKHVVDPPVSHPAEEPEKAKIGKEKADTANLPVEPVLGKEPDTVNLPPEPVVAPVPKPPEVVMTERPSSETAYSTPSGFRPPPLPTTPTKGQPFPTSGSPGSQPSSPTSFRFNSLRSGGVKKRPSFLQKIRDHFKSNKGQPKAQEKK